MCDIMMLNFIIYYTGTGSRKRFWINRRKLCPRACLVAANNSPHQTHFFGDALPVAGSGQNVSPAHPSITVVRSAIQMEGLHLTKKIQRQTWMSHSCKIKTNKDYIPQALMLLSFYLLSPQHFFQYEEG